MSKHSGHPKGELRPNGKTPQASSPTSGGLSESGETPQTSGGAQTNGGAQRPVQKDRSKLYMVLINWWTAGALYFFIGWGTQLGAMQSSVDFIVILGLAYGFIQGFLLLPAYKMLFNAGDYKPYGISTYKSRFLLRMRELLLGFVAVLLVSQLYRAINIGAILLFNLPKEEVFLPGEPILFGLFTMLVMILLRLILTSITNLFTKKS